MKKILLSGAVLLAMVGVASATLVTENYSGSEIAIPDGNPVGIVNSLSVSGASGAIEDVSVNLDISGGYNGDLYGYLVFQPTSGSSATALLLNQIGTSGSNPFGYSSSGFNVTLSDSGTSNGDIHGANVGTGNTVTGIWQPDQSAGINLLDSTFNQSSANGTWTLFLADLSAGGGTSELVSWGVNISVVPEPITWALLGFAGVLGLARFIAWRGSRTQKQI